MFLCPPGSPSSGSNPSAGKARRSPQEKTHRSTGSESEQVVRGDINPPRPTSLQPLDILIDISQSALTLKGVTFHLHTTMIKMVAKRKGGMGSLRETEVDSVRESQDKRERDRQTENE